MVLQQAMLLISGDPGGQNPSNYPWWPNMSIIHQLKIPENSLLNNKIHFFFSSATNSHTSSMGSGRNCTVSGRTQTLFYIPRQML